MATFPTALGWMGVVGSGGKLCRLLLGYPSAAVIKAAIRDDRCVRDCDWCPSLVQRLQSFANGRPDGFSDVRIDTSGMTEFTSGIIRTCRHIPFGQTMTYGQLAAKAGFPGAARAAGNVMAANRVPLIVPCHRIVGSGNRWGGFSAPGGVRTKRRLLKWESAVLSRLEPGLIPTSSIDC